MATSYCYTVIRPPQYTADYIRYGKIEEDLTEIELTNKIASWEKQQPFNPRNIHVINMEVNGVSIQTIS